MMENFSPKQLATSRPEFCICLECKCWDSKDDESGNCLAHAPHPAIVSGDAADYTMARPVTMAHDGCFHDFIHNYVVK